ncbi:hypothetical protein GUJ93_ZPchr0007g5327 [Zizania palustris]|uniref:Secreted protein n=1 Tax=Zizania palustris TaxID=103762 RepID=A0A8J5SVM5_ZIZPA|nr:hypothetical protein GUJ93_ZPchr0007g5327 [Zizania palustris]
MWLLLVLPADLCRVIYCSNLPCFVTCKFSTFSSFVNNARQRQVLDQSWIDQSSCQRDCFSQSRGSIPRRCCISFPTPDF